MENKKFIIITIILFLVGGMGTFVFATRSDDIAPEDINYSKEPTYQKVDKPTIDNKLDDTPVVDQNPPVVPDDADNNEIENNETNNGGSISSDKKPVTEVKPVKPAEPKPAIPDNNKPEENKPIDTPSTNTGTSSGSSYNRDKTAPTLTIAYSNLNQTKDDVVVTITANEKISGLSGWALSSNQMSLTKSFTYNETREITVYDIAGNGTKITYDIKNIDKTSPVAIVTTSNNNGHKQTYKDITVTITADEDIKEVAGWTLTDNRILTKTFGEESYTKDETGKLIIEPINVEVTITDLVGNITKVPYEVKNYNPYFPEVSIEKVKNEDGTIKITVKQTYKEPISGEGWIENEDGEYTKEDSVTYTSDEADATKGITIAGTDGTIERIGKDEITTTSPTGEVTADNVLSVNVDVDNYNAATGEFTPTNKAKVTVKANKEIEKPSYCYRDENVCELSEDLKTLEIYVTKKGTLHETIYDLAGNSVVIDQLVSKVNSNPLVLDGPPDISSDGCVYIYTKNEIYIPNGWEADRTYNVKEIYKNFTNNQIIEGVEEEITLNDIYGHSLKIKLIVRKVNNKNNATYEIVE